MLDSTSIKAVVFDYGNTLIPFGMGEITALDRDLAAALERLFGHVDAQRVAEIRHQNRLAPYHENQPTFRENDLTDLSRTLVQEIYGRPPTAAELQQILDARHDSFVQTIRTEGGVHEVLQQLGQRYALGLLSNYPSGKAIRDSLQVTGLADYFSSVVVSDDVRFVKPHALPFQTVLAELQLTPEQAVYVGDNWLADVQGAKGQGWQMILTEQWGGAPEGFERQPGDHEPDAIIQALGELLDLL